MTKHINTYVVIFSLVTVLALATASECHSITYLPSLLYGAVLWEWWGLIAGALWKWGKQTCFLSRPSVLAIAIQLLAGTALGIAHLLLLDSLGNSLLNINRLGMEVLIYGFLFGMTGIIQFQLRAQLDAMESLSLQRQLSTAHLRARQMQLEPHFLFRRV